MIIFIYGQDTYSSREKLKQLREKFFKEVDSARLNYTKLAGQKLDLENFVKTVLAPAFLANKRMIVIENLFSQNKDKKFRDKLFELILERDIEKTENILVFYEENVDKKETRDKFFSWLASQRYAQEFTALSNIELERWLKKEVAARGAIIEARSIDLLISFIGNDLWQLTNELDKLVAYKTNQQERILTDVGKITISEDDIKLLVKGKISEDIFALTDALGRKDKKLALRLLGSQLDSGLHPAQILSMIIWQFRVLLMAKDLLASQPQARLSSRLGIHPYVAQKALLSSHNFNLDELKMIYGRLLEIDSKIKTGHDPVLSLDLFIATI